MKLRVVGVLAIAAMASSCAMDPTWERIRPPVTMVHAANGCPLYTIDDAAPLSQWKNVGDFWDQDVCQGTPFVVAEIKGKLDLSREQIRKKAAEGEEDSINLAKCWDQKGHLSWTAPASSSLIGHEWDDLPYACVEKSDPRLTASGAPASPQVAGK